MLAVWLTALALSVDDAPPAKPKKADGGARKADGGARKAEMAALEAQAKKLIAERPKSEGAAMAKAILAGEPPEAGFGWFKEVADKKLDWPWVAARFGVPKDGAIKVADYDLPKALVVGLDRDGNGVMDADDFDWSPKSEWMEQDAAMKNLFSKVDADGSGKLSENEWKKFFAKAGAGEALTHADLRNGMFPPAKGGGKGGPPKGMLLKGLFAGEIGCIEEGPNLGDPAPKFELATKDGKKVRLADLAGAKPVVLIFGSFT